MRTTYREALAWFEKGSGTVAGTARRVLRTTVPDPFLNPANPTSAKNRPLISLATTCGSGWPESPVAQSRFTIGSGNVPPAA